MNSKSFSLTLLLSAPALSMHQPPTPIKDTTDVAQPAQAFIGFHTFNDDVESIPVIKDSEESILQELAARTKAIEAEHSLHQQTTVVAAQETKPFYIKTDLEKLRDAILSRLDAYESNPEKYLDKKGVQIYKLNTLATSIKYNLCDSSPLLVAWLKDPVTTQPSAKLAEFAKQLDADMNDLESLGRSQIDRDECRNITGYQSLKTAFETFGKEIAPLMNEKFKQPLTDISNPAVQLLLAHERLETLLK